jgi:quercetin dioxygenase-like cupin family protein
MSIFPAPILNLPEADIPLAGIKAYLSQGNNHQIIFMEFSEEVDLPEHAHAAQWGVVLAGKIALTINGIEHTFQTGDNYYIPEGAVHFGKIYAGYADMTYFAEGARYKIKEMAVQP